MSIAARFLILGMYLLGLSCESGQRTFHASTKVSPKGSVALVVEGTLRWVSEEACQKRGLTLVDLSDNWVPHVFTSGEGRSGRTLQNHLAPLYRELAGGAPIPSPTQIAAQRRFSSRTKSTGTDSPSESPYLEVYGVAPSLSQLKNRVRKELADECFKKIRYDKIRSFRGAIAYKSNRDAKAYVSARDEHDGGYLALLEIQKQLVCEGLLAGEYIAGGLDWETHRALAVFERKNGIVGWGNLGGETLAALSRGPERRLFDAFYRVLMERVVDATGIIEDGTAKRVAREPFYRDRGGIKRPLPDLVGRYTAWAMKALGLSSPRDVVDFLEGLDEERLGRLKLALRFPKLPPYHAATMKLYVTVDRGDVWYDYPYTADGRRQSQPRERKPSLTLWTSWRGQKIPLVSFETTIGGWQSEMAEDGYKYLKYKESVPGKQFWRQIVAGPVWIPPPTTDPRDVIKEVFSRGRWIRVPDADKIGPWYASAYGLVAAIHNLRVDTSQTGEWVDNGIRSHGSYDYTSVYSRYSHGCHRLKNNLAIRLFGFVLRHTPHKRLGHLEQKAKLGFELKGRTYRIVVNDRGYTYELEKPIPVEILPGRIVGQRLTPIERHMPLPGVTYPPEAGMLLR